ncbi:TPA: restriction endonuclease subunit S [Vibrio parahaemolyticus]|uniref:restriction endonuclease subunit S n=1 Tax=Vibrio parahaemolyticus TaxID=670 RepID=UPI001121709F|nr:restriction endonuclease subunit S [Vibrio parahaemolyticus]MCX8828234.1 restriction endonuclease subunit S [Vibrio parahaemolyticus]MCX8929022.1 restriction endonuclease subunit S [Vibrio parahaemolyticus]HBN6202030.1 restriction endonuclease subunit S [Vibrio parahaemolyticus]
MSELPKGWISTRIEDISTKCTQRKPEDCEELKYIDIGSIDRKNKTVATPQYLIGKDAPSRARKVVHVHDVIVSLTRPNLNAVALIPDELDKQFASTGFEIIRPIEGVDSRFIFALVRSNRFVDAISGVVKGALYPAAKSVDVRNYEFGLPPLNEQIRIANKLDSILAKVDKAQAHLDKIPAILKRFRQSVLAAATSGELTKEWREEMGFTKDTWLPTSIDSLSVRAFDGPFGSKLKTADYTDHGIKVARLENIGHLVFNAEKQTFISETKYQELVKNTLEHNDVLFSSFVDEEIRTCLFDERFGTHINKADCFCIRPNQEIVSPEFLMYSLACKHTYEKIKKQVHGATRPRVNLRFLKSFEIAIPNPKEQLVVVDKINQLFSKANKVERQYLEAKARLDRLTQSILAKAFRGELVPQDPNDEPAEKLLERIVAEKEQSKPKKTTRKRAATKAKTAEKE